MFKKGEKRHTRVHIYQHRFSTLFIPLQPPPTHSSSPRARYTIAPQGVNFGSGNKNVMFLGELMWLRLCFFDV